MCCRVMSCRRAISATRLPSTSASAKIRSFSSTDQRRRRSGPDKISWRFAYLVDDVHNDVANDVNSPPKPSAVRRPKSAGYDLTAHRTAALRMELAGKTDVALTAVVHALALPVFFPHEDKSCLELSLDSAPLHGSAEGIEDSPAAKALAEWHASWRRKLPPTPEA